MRLSVRADTIIDPAGRGCNPARRRDPRCTPSDKRGGGGWAKQCLWRGTAFRWDQRENVAWVLATRRDATALQGGHYSERSGLLFAYCLRMSLYARRVNPTSNSLAQKLLSRSGQGQNRTADTVIFSHVLYQLSYLARAKKLLAGGGPMPVYRATLSPMIPTTIRAIDARRSGCRDSSRRMMPSIAVPTAPIPTHTAYPVPAGSTRIACARSHIDASIAITVITLGAGFENPALYLRPIAQVISKRPAMMT